MKKPKVDPVNLPYASNVASWSRDQGANGSSFLGRMWKGKLPLDTTGKPPTSTSSNNASGAGMLK